MQTKPDLKCFIDELNSSLPGIKLNVEDLYHWERVIADLFLKKFGELPKYEVNEKGQIKLM